MKHPLIVDGAFLQSYKFQFFVVESPHIYNAFFDVGGKAYLDKITAAKKINWHLASPISCKIQHFYLLQ